MVDNNTINRITKAIPQHDLRSLQDIAIFQDELGRYNLFGTYIITKENENFNVTLETTYTSYEFSTLKNAVTWCTLDKRNRIIDAKRIVQLDKKLTSLDTAIIVHTNLVRKAKSPEDRLIYLAKLSGEKLEKRKILEEIDTYINDSKRWQTQRFDRKPAH
jgi:hypothetical protein